MLREAERLEECPGRGPYKPTLILHGGAGAVTRANLPPELYEQYHASLKSYLTQAHTALNNPTKAASAIEAACLAVAKMEDDPLFNCGRGSVFTEQGEIEMEASLMVTSVHEKASDSEGMVKRSAAVSMIRNTRHPIYLAREVLRMADSDGGFGKGVSEMHGHLSGRDVEEWGWKSKGLEKKGKRWFWTRKRWDEHRRGLAKDQYSDITSFDRAQNDMNEENDDDDDDGGTDDGTVLNLDSLHNIELPSQGTVGCVCLDSWGNLAVATSTGGLTNKKSGRIGDTPSVGAGFWAESWSEDLPNHSNEFAGNSVLEKSRVVAEQLFGVASAEVKSWLGNGLSECFASSANDGYRQAKQLSEHDFSFSADHKIVERYNASRLEMKIQPLRQQSWPRGATTRRRAVAMSGTGNGDSFLRTAAVRTSGAMCRFSRPPTSLSDAVTAVAGPDGELQRSAGPRWGHTGEGQGGIIGIEAIYKGDERDDRNESSRLQSNVIFDFNCGGMWRAWYEKDENGKATPRIMVFKNEYHS